MRLIRCALALAMLLLSCSAFAEDAPSPEAAKPTVTINTSAQARETRDYKVIATIKGRLPADGGAAGDIDAGFTYRIRHTYSRRDDEGVLPVEVNLLEGDMTIDAQKISITPSLYPKLSVLLDRDWKISEIFGMSESQLAQTLPGLNYGNLIMLFYAPDGAKPHAVGDTWESTVRLRSYGESYKFVNTLKGVTAVDGVEAAVLRQEITRLPKAGGVAAAGMKATVESTFAIDTGKLLKSHAECQVTPSTGPSAQNNSTAGQDQSPYRANIKIDIVLEKEP